MDNIDALKTFSFKEGGASDYVTIKEGAPQKLRVLTLDPIVHVDKFANTRYAFVVYNFTEKKAMILDKGASIAKGISALHMDEDYDDIDKIDIKITATGEGMETRYSINVLPKTEVLTKEQIEECGNIKLDEIIRAPKQRMSKLNEGAPMPKAEETNMVDDVFQDSEPLSLDSIPY